MTGGGVDDGTDDGSESNGSGASAGTDDHGTDEPENDGQRFDRLPATSADRTVPGRPSRAEVLDWWEERYGIPPETFADHGFWEKGAGKVWAVHADVSHPDPSRIEALGMKVLRTRQEHWKPTTDGVQRFGDAATRNVVDLDDGEAALFVAGEDQDLAWDGDWGYLIAAHDCGGGRAPLGVGLYLHGELRSMVPKGRRQGHRG